MLTAQALGVSNRTLSSLSEASNITMANSYAPVSYSSMDRVLLNAVCSAVHG